MECPICDYPHVVPRYRLSDRFFGTVDGEFVLYYCRSCGLLFQDEPQLGRRLDEFYPSGYWWEEGSNSFGLEKAYREWVVRRDQLNFLLSLFPKPESYRLLDIGCGSGTFLKLAGEAGFEAYGLEQSEEASRIAQRNQAGTVLQGSVQDLVSQGEQFDIVTLFHALEHMSGPFRFLRELHKLVRKPGRFIIQVPNARSLQAAIFGSRWYGLDCPRHLYNFSTYSLLHLLGRTGFRTQRIRYFSLRDNAAALISSLFPGLDPMSQRVKLIRRKGRSHSPGLVLKEAVYFSLLMLAQPLAWLEARLGRGATVTVYATLDEPLIPRA